jgi:hypothetical protein
MVNLRRVKELEVNKLLQQKQVKIMMAMVKLNLALKNIEDQYTMQFNARKVELLTVEILQV